MEEWYYVKGGQQQGPVSLEQLRDMATTGTLLPTDLVWNATMTDWVPASEVSGICSPAATGSPLTTATSTPATATDPAAGATRVEITPGQEPLDISATFSSAFGLYKLHFATLTIQGLIYFGISFVLGLIPAIVQGIGSAAAESGNEDVGVALLLFSLLLQIPVQIATLWLGLGLFRSCLMICDGGSPEVRTVFGEGRNLLHAVLASIIVCIIVLIGLVLLIIPGIYLALRLAFVIPAIVDRNMSCIDAIAYSFQVTSRNSLRLFGLWLLAAITMIVGVLVTCGVGILFLTPLFTLGLVIVYRRLQYGSNAVQ